MPRNSRKIQITPLNPPKRSKDQQIAKQKGKIYIPTKGNTQKNKKKKKKRYSE